MADLADRLGVTRGEKGIAEAVKYFRERTAKLLAEQAHLACEGNDVIATTARGYQLLPKLNVQVTAPRKRESGTLVVPERSDADARKQWLLDQLQNGKKLRRRDYEAHFSISTPTAKRDLASLDREVEFIGTGETGYYRLVTA